MVHRIRDMDPAQRPRERLLDHGPGSLSDAELLALLLRSGRRDRGAIGEAHELLREVGGLVELARLELPALLGRPGLGPATVASLKAAFELGRRLATAELRRAERVDHPEAAGQLLARLLQGHNREVFGLLSLDGTHRLIRNHELSLGTSRQAPVEPAELFRTALLDRAEEILVYHNHPSGEPEPSRDDLALTRRLAQAGATIGVPLVDHVVVAGTRWTSLRRTHPELFAVG